MAGLLTPLFARLFPPIVCGILAGQATERDYAILAATADVDPAEVREVERLTARGLARLRPVFRIEPGDRFRLLVHRDSDSVPPGVRLHPRTAGVALLERREIHVFLAESRRHPPHDLATVVEHELVHLLLHDYAGDAARWVPRWFHEGLAQYLSGKPYLSVSEDVLAYRRRIGRLIPLSDLREGFPDDPDEVGVAYAQSFSLVSFLAGRVGLPTVLRAAKAGDERNWYRGGFFRITGESMAGLEEGWQQYLAHESGAGFRFVLQNCFSYLMVGAFVLLALAGIRAAHRDAAARDRLARLEQLEAEAAAQNPSDGSSREPPEGN